MAARTPRPSPSKAPTAGSDSRDTLDLSIIGRTGLKAFSGRIYEEFDPNLSQERWVRICREMTDNEPVIGSGLYVIEMLMRGVEWRVDPADETPQAKLIAQKFQEMIFDMDTSWQDTLTDILSMLPWGWSFMETNFKQRNGDSLDPTQYSKYNDGWVGWRNLGIRSQDSLLRWELDAEGGTEGMWQLAPPSYIPALIPSAKALHFRTRPRKGSPQGFSMLRSCYRPWYFKKRIENLLGIGIERDLAGLPVMFVPPQIMDPQASEADQALFATIKQMVTNIRRDEQEGVVMPMQYDGEGHPLFDFKLLTTGGTRQFDMLGVLNYYDQRMAIAMLTDFLLLGHEQVGTFALASSKTGTFDASCSATLDGIAETVNEQGFPPLMRLNALPMDLCPKLSHGDVQSVDLAEVGAYLQALGMAGIPLAPDTDLQSYLYRIAHFPTPQTDQDMVDDYGTGFGTQPSPPGISPLPTQPAPPPAPGMNSPEAPYSDGNTPPAKPPSGINPSTFSSPGGAPYVRRPPSQGQ